MMANSIPFFACYSFDERNFYLYSVPLGSFYGTVIDLCAFILTCQATF